MIQLYRDIVYSIQLKRKWAAKFATHFLTQKDILLAQYNDR
jgi:hypothetical protein